MMCQAVTFCALGLMLSGSPSRWDCYSVIQMVLIEFYSVNLFLNIVFFGELNCEKQSSKFDC